MPSASAAPSVTVEDECTKRCSVCGEDRPVSAFSSAQLKKKGKRVCHACVCKKNAAAAAQQQAAAASSRKEAMKDAFAARLNSTPTQAVTACLCCESKAAVRFAPCVRCTVVCCSLKCFDRHDCDAYLEAKRTIPTELIPEEDRLHSADDIVSSWKDLLAYLRALPASVSVGTVHDSADELNRLRQLDCVMIEFVEKVRLPHWLYSPLVSRPWWNPAASTRVCFVDDIHALATVLIKLVAAISQVCDAVIVACAATMTADLIEPKATIHGAWLSVATIDRTSACFLPRRLLHKLLTLLRWILRAMGSAWVEAHFDVVGDVSNDAFGHFPSVSSGEGKHGRLGYLELPDPLSGLRTLVPLNSPATPSRLCKLSQNLGLRGLAMVLRDGELLMDRGLFLRTTQRDVEVCAVSGWTGDVMDSFSTAPTRSVYWSDQWLLQTAHHRNYRADVRRELEARKRPDYFHLVLAIKQLIPEDEWPSAPGSGLFLATPQPGVEYELVELSLLESLVEDAAAGNEQAQLLLSHIEAECAAPISDVISAQKSRLAQMLEDQAAQLRIHAEAVKRAEMRGRLRGPTTESEDGAEGPAASVSVSSSSDSALAPTSAASSASAAVSSASTSSSLSGPAYSWTQSREYAGLESLRAPGRKKYSTIMSAAKRLLYSLSPVSVNKRAGSHIVFHFASGAPATLVQMHAGARSKDSTAHTTRLFAQLSEVAMQQGMAGASAIEGATEAGREGAGHRLLN